MREALDLSILTESRAKPKNPYFEMWEGKKVQMESLGFATPAVETLAQEGRVVIQHSFDEQGNIGRTAWIPEKVQELELKVEYERMRDRYLTHKQDLYGEKGKYVRKTA